MTTSNQMQSSLMNVTVASIPSWTDIAASCATLANTAAYTSLTIEGDIVMTGQSLTERLSTIEKVLAIPTRSIELENKYPKLKELYIEYMRELDKLTTFEKLKK